MEQENTSPQSIPSHVGIIMDGNGRWATERNLPRLVGHREGYKTLRNILLGAHDLGIRYLTAYAFSAENWTRPKDEVIGLMSLIEQAAIDELRIMHQNNVKVLVAGRLDEVPKSLRVALLKGVETTANNTGITFVLAINYGGRGEIVDAINKILNNRHLDTITEELFRNYLYLPEVPDPDLLIRTAGEMRLSNFLLWQCAYSELIVLEKPWPEFTLEDLAKCCREYASRIRKFGAISP